MLILLYLVVLFPNLILAMLKLIFLLCLLIFLLLFPLRCKITILSLSVYAAKIIHLKGTYNCSCSESRSSCIWYLMPLFPSTQSSNLNIRLRSSYSAVSYSFTAAMNRPVPSFRFNFSSPSFTIHPPLFKSTTYPLDVV